MQVGGEPSSGPVLVVERDHPDTPRLPVAPDGELHPLGGTGRRSELADDVVNLGARAMAEEGEGEMQVRLADDTHLPDARERGGLPGDEALEHRVGKAKGAKQSDPLIPAHGTAEIHTSSCRFCDKRRRTRWSADA